MGLYTELVSENDFIPGVSPKNVLPSNRHWGRVGNRIPKRKPTCRKDLLMLEKDFRENFYSIPSNRTKLEGEVLKRGSIYQSSEAVRKIKELRTLDVRRKVENPCHNDSKVSIGIVNSLYSLDEENADVELKKPLVGSRSSNLNKMGDRKPYKDLRPNKFLEFSFRSPSSASDASETGVSSDGFYEIVLDLEKRDSAKTVDIDSIENLKTKCDQMIGPLNDGNDHLEIERAVNYHKSLSAKVRMHYSPSPSDSDRSKDSPRSRFHPIQKMFDPFMKSNSHRSSLSSTMEPDEVAPTCIASNRRKKMFRKSLLHDFSTMIPNTDSGSLTVKMDNHSDVPCSPAHLQGSLKLEHRHGMPYFEFSVTCPEDAFVAKTWKTDNSFNWVYTFHSIRGKKKSSTSPSGWGLKDGNKNSSMVGQMQVSCYLCSEIKEGGTLDNSLMTEFVLYDIAHAKKCFNLEESSNCSPSIKIATHSTGSKECLDKGTGAPHNVLDSPKLKAQKNHAFDNADINCSTSYPWLQSDLHPYLEVAAIVFQVPFEKRESMKYKRGDNIVDKKNPSFLDPFLVEQRKEYPANTTNPAKVKVITPTGHHGLPSTESQGPSSLLDRWRLGGGCDCGGWDMACPLIIFSSPSAEGYLLVENQQPLQLFVQGAEEKIPALTVKLVEEGRYAVDFHAQLSALQAFSICVAMLHGAEASTTVGQERNRQLLQKNSLKLVIEEEVKFLIEAVTEEDKRNVTQKMQEVPPSFIVNPPFSPIARV